MRTRPHNPAFAIAAVLAVAALGRARADGAQMAAGLGADVMYLGAQTLLTVEVRDADTTDWPAVAAVEGLRIQRYGSPNVIQDLLSGRITRQFRFLITPDKAGTFTIPAVTLQAGSAQLKQGPFTLRVVEAQLKCRGVEVDPKQILVGEKARLDIYYQGVRPDMRPVVPPIEGLEIRPVQFGRVEVDRQERLPITIHTFEVEAKKLGRYSIAGITFDGMPADAVVLDVAPFVIVGTQIGQNSLVVGSQTTLHVVVRGLPQSTALTLVAPAGLKIAPSTTAYRRRTAGAVFSFDITAAEPGNFTIDTLRLPDGRDVKLAEPVTVSARQGGEGGIFVCRGTPRTDETIVGEPFIVDYEVFFRGDFRGAGVDLGQAAFANKDYIRIEPVNELSYPNWQGQAFEAQLSGNRRITMLCGSGDFNNQKEQLLRFALRITPLATGELSLDGLRVILLLHIREEQRTAFSTFVTSSTKQVDRLAEVPPHQVIDPPGITRPPLYRGAVGTAFTFTTRLDRTTATAMSPLTVTMEITGDSVGLQFVPPPLTAVPELTKNFEVSPTVSGGETAGNTITFTQIVRPRSESVAELPALPLVYYNYSAKKYDTAYSLPIPLQINPGRLVGATAMEGATAPPPPSQDRTPEDSRAAPLAALGANHASLGDLVKDEPLRTRHLVLVLLLGPACVIMVWVGEAVYRRRRPYAATRQQLRKLANDLRQLDRTETFYADLAGILQAYLRLSLGLPPGELSPSMVSTILGERGADDLLRDDMVELINTCDAGRFAAGTVSDDEKGRLKGLAHAALAQIDRIAG